MRLKTDLQRSWPRLDGWRHGEAIATLEYLWSNEGKGKRDLGESIQCRESKTTTCPSAVSRSSSAAFASMAREEGAKEAAPVRTVHCTMRRKKRDMRLGFALAALNWAKCPT